MTAVHLRCTPTRHATHSEAGPHRNTIFWVGLRNIPHLAVSTHALDALEEAGLFREASLRLPPPRSSLHSRLSPGCLPLQNKGSLWVLCPPRASAPTEARPGTWGRSGHRGLQFQAGRSLQCSRSWTFLDCTFPRGMSVIFLFAGGEGGATQERPLQ